MVGSMAEYSLAALALRLAILASNSASLCLRSASNFLRSNPAFFSVDIRSFWIARWPEGSSPTAEERGRLRAENFCREAQESASLNLGLDAGLCAMKPP